MGLDMYLYAVTLPKQISLYQREIHGKGNVKANSKADFELKQKIVEVAYWRKVNCVHKWFVVNCQNGVDDCNEYKVSKEQLEMLLQTTKRVLVDHSLALSLLPPQTGFFFGSTEVDNYYFGDLEETEEMLEKIMEDWKTNGYDYFIYRSSW